LESMPGRLLKQQALPEQVVLLAPGQPAVEEVQGIHSELICNVEFLVSALARFTVR